MKLILPMAGKGQRFKTDGYDVPKAFLPIDGVPMFARAIQHLPEFQNVIFICLKEHESLIKQYLPRAEVHTVDSVTDGQACTCEIGIKAGNINEDESILISACDNGATYDEQKLFDLIDDPSVDVVVWSFTNHPTGKNNPNMYSWLDVNAEGDIRSVSCKRFVEGRKHAIIGTMYFRKAKYFLDGLKANQDRDLRTNGEFYVDDVINRNIEHGLKVKVFEVDDYICWGTPNDYKTYLYWSDYFKK